ncbi:MAG TPA: endonuclease III [Clostridiales bacterium]|nr:endonuclease III [Clostridiales bacterium]
MDKYTAYNIINILDKFIPNPETELEYNSDFELLIAVMLSAQCTDKRVNMVTKDLFKLYNTPEDFANLDVKTLERLIHSCGFYHNKAVNIINCSRMIVDKYNGKVPRTFEELVTLPGVGRKTANVMLIVAFGTPAIPVDTHIFRVSNRIGLTDTNNVDDCENQLTTLFKDDPQLWGKIHHLILLYGRYNCKAINPDCTNCVIKKYCKHYNEK